MNEVFRALRMPLQAASLLFIGVTSVLLGLVMSIGGIAAVIAIPAIYLLLTWIVQFTFRLIDDAANGRPETAAASVEMLSPWGDARCWIHPLLTILVAGALLVYPEIPRLPVLVVCALLLPASIGATALTGNAIDAINPLVMTRVVRGLAHFYPLAVLWLVLCAAVAVLVMLAGMWKFLEIAALLLLLLLAFAFIGGAMHARRVELGFVPQVSPEREEERIENERIVMRQRMIDGLFADLRGREPARALDRAKEWIAQAASHHLAGDVRAMLEAGARWPEPRRFAQLLRGLVPQLMAMRQPGPAFAAVEAGTAAMPGFAPEQESDAVAMVRYALQTGRKRVAGTLLENFLAQGPRQVLPGSDLEELRARLRNEPVTTQS